MSHLGLLILWVHHVDFNRGKRFNVPSIIWQRGSVLDHLKFYSGQSLLICSLLDDLISHQMLSFNFIHPLLIHDVFELVKQG